MLPSCGHFKNIPCPFYKLALCVRPHCPYKHQAAENSHRQLFTPLADESESLFDSKVSLDGITSKSPFLGSTREIQQDAKYIPTPVDSSVKPQGILKSSSNFERPSTSFVPEYKPTPINRLKECTTIPVKPSKSVYTPDFPAAVKKKKNVEEYDPTEVKCVPKKSVTFVDQTDDVTDVPVILISSDEDLDDVEEAPTFSDDDFEDETFVSNPVKQVPSVQVKEEVVEEEKIDEFSVVDKILVDCKKNELLLSSFKKIPPKTNISSSVQTLGKNKVIDLKNSKNNSSVSIKVEKIESDSKVDKKSESIHKPKHKKGEAVDSSKVKRTDDLKKDSKSGKNEISNEKNKKNSSSHSSHSKEKLKKDSKDIDKLKHVKKLSHETKKPHTTDNKSSKSDKHSDSESSNKKDSKKRPENQISSSPLKKKSKHENTNNVKSPELHISKTKEKSSAVHTNKKKSDVSDSDSERHNLKSKLSPEKKKQKLNSGTSPPKHSNSTAFSESKTDDGDGSSSESDIDMSALQDLISSESDPEMECRRIFEECYPDNSQTEKPKKNEEVQQPKSSKEADIVILRKKRYAHPAAEMKPPKKQAKVEAKRPINPAQVMHNRFVQCQARFAQSNENKNATKVTEKKRICMPNSSLLAAAVKNKELAKPALENFTPLPPTVSKSLKVTKRTAHVPEAAMKPRPIIPAEYGCKVPVAVRQKFLNAFIDECLKFCLSEDEAYDLAIEEEKKVYERSSSRALYLNVAANGLNRLRRRAEEGPDTGKNDNASSKSNPNKKTVSHQTVLNGPLAQRRSFSVGRKKEVPEIKGGAELYEFLLQYVMTKEQLKENSYPLPHPTEKDRAVIEGAYANRTLYCNDAFKRMCSRCHKTYYVNVDGDYVRDEECDFHWGRLWKKRIAGNFESRYSCCQGDAESDGCCVSPGHVFDGSEAHVLKGYVRTLPKTPPRDKYYGIYALDCEMCYTTAGMELTRITVVDTDLNTVYESFVKPLNKVLDYNTRFSGITEDDLKNVRTSLIDVQAVLLCIFNDKSILIGHSLESDFKALKLFHSTVIDTSVVFPHKSGLPYKRALKTLMAEKLNKIIQNDVGGHDSREDAVACMELMLWKVKEDVRGNR